MASETSNGRADSSATQDFFDENSRDVSRFRNNGSGYSYRENYRERFNSNESHVFSDRSRMESAQDDKILKAWKAEKPNNA